MGTASTSLALWGSAAAFTVTHWAVLRWAEPDYEVAFKLSRGCAAIVLTVLGLAAVIDSAEHVRSAFVYRHDDGDWMRLGLLVAYGHLIADFLWMAFGGLVFANRPRVDLIIHHGLGAIAFGYALHLHVGYALALLTMTTEILPVTTGLGALGRRIRSPALIAAAERMRLHVLAWVRLPLWTLLFVMALDVLRADRAGDLYWAFVTVGSGLIVLITLDIHWLRQCRERGSRGYRSPAGRTCEPEVSSALAPRKE